MYAIIADGGRQYKVEQGQELDIDYRQASAGESIQFDTVLVVSDDTGLKIGTPSLAGARVTANVLGVRFGPKLVVQYLRRRKNSRRRTGHRQMYTTVRVQSIEV